MTLACICMPTYKERENLEIVIPRIMGIFDEHDINGILLIVDDSSPDGTAEFVNE